VKNIVGLLGTESFVVPDQEVLTELEADHSTESATRCNTFELDRTVMRVSPYFELASVSHGLAHGPRSSRQENMIEDVSLKVNIDAALALIVTRLTDEEALIATNRFQPSENGCLEVSTSFHVECNSSISGVSQTKCATEKMAAWEDVFRTGLTLLDDDYCFRQIDEDVAFVQGQRRFISFDTCTVAGQTAMGFTASTHDKTSAVTLPIFASTREPKIWPEALEKTIKAARAQKVGTTVGIRIARFALTGEHRSRLEKLDVNSDPQGRHHSVVLSRTIRAYLEHAGEFLRIDPFVEVAQDSVQSENRAGCFSTRPSTLVDIFTKEVLPLHSNARLADAVVVQRSDTGSLVPGCLDLTTVMPYSGSLPPMLAKPQVLRELDFPRHHGNHAVRMSQEGLLLGTAQVGGFEQMVRLPQSDRSRHIYLVGGTGTGKSKLMFSMIRQDLIEGRGLALCDPGGDIFEEVLSAVPKNRINDVVIIDPSDASMAVGLNPLDFGEMPTPLSVNRVIGDLLDIFDHLYNMKLCGGPRFEQFFRNAMLLASTAPYESPSIKKGCPSFVTMLAILQDDDFRKQVLNNVRDSFLGQDMGGEVVDFFEAEKATSGEGSFANMVPYISCKLTRFTSNPLMRPLVGSGARTIDFRKVMDEKKILLVNLSKGAIGSLDATMIGMLVTKGLFGAALSRFDIPQDQRMPFTYYVDEFQNVVTDIATILAEGRKWGLQTVLAHQTLGQLRVGGSAALLDAILGNVPTKLLLRTGIEEAAILEQAMQPQIDKMTLAQLPDREVAARLLINNKVSMPFIFKTMTVTDHRSPEDRAHVAALARQSSRTKYGVRGKESTTIVLAAVDESDPLISELGVTH